MTGVSTLLCPLYNFHHLHSLSSSFRFSHSLSVSLSIRFFRFLAMADQQMPSKRQREVTQSLEGHVEESKRHKSYNHMLSLLEEEEDETNQDLSSLITTLQQELSSSHSVSDDSLPHRPTTTTLEANQESPSTAAAAAYTIGGSLEDYTSATSSLKEDEDDGKERVIRHLLEATDDELGIANKENVVDFEEGLNNGGHGFAVCDGLWELEDEAANYYTLLQSELFM